MRIALDLAQKGMGWVSPNPMVGAVIVKDDRIIGMGYHAKYGDLHAERAALANCTESVQGADMYVTLEPCCHYGKQPPCVEAILQSGISTVIVGSDDPNPLVSGKGIEYLKLRGVKVETGILKEECDKLNEVFFHFIQTGTPYVVMKYAMTLDGKIATYTGNSKWITGESARKNVHYDRHRYSAIMVGIGTVLADDPMLTCRIDGCKNPIRIICDTNLRMPKDSKIVKTAGEIPTILATCCTDISKQKIYTNAGCRVMVVPEEDGHVDLKALMRLLGAEKIDSILLEGGSTLNWSALKSSIVNKIQAYISPKIFGGESAKTPIGGIGVSTPEDAVKLKNTSIIKLGNDFLLEGEVDKDVYRNC